MVTVVWIMRPNCRAEALKLTVCDDMMNELGMVTTSFLGVRRRVTNGVEESPKPFVLETELQDYYPCYQINAYIKDADRQAQMMTDLLQNIPDICNEAGVAIMSPKYVATRDGNASTIPSDPLTP